MRRNCNYKLNGYSFFEESPEEPGDSLDFGFDMDLLSVFDSDLVPVLDSDLVAVLESDFSPNLVPCFDSFFEADCDLSL